MTVSIELGVGPLLPTTSRDFLSLPEQETAWREASLTNDGGYYIFTVVVYGYCLVTAPAAVSEIGTGLTWLSIVMQRHSWW